MNNLKNVYIKAPKKTINNKNTKMIIKKHSLKKIDSELIRNNFIPIDKKKIDVNMNFDQKNYIKQTHLKLKNDTIKQNKQKLKTHIFPSLDTNRINKKNIFDKKKKVILYK